ncbi:MAG: response regulator transcription factor [Acutalibacteraceae bacterium]|nr:response regulator transcription factor [Acutalibacteraceae bacterium]
MVRVLIIEDDQELNQLLSEILRRYDYEIETSRDGINGLQLARNGSFDIILLDLMLPYKSGDEVLKELRMVSYVPVIVISAKDTVQTKIELFRLGADDYITKPFDINELIVRIEAALRHRAVEKAFEKKVYVFKDMILNADEKSVQVNGVYIALTMKEYRILELMLKNPKKVYTKANIFESVWNDTFVYDDKVVNTHISNLRSKLRKVNPKEEYVETVWGIGYKLAELN